MKVTILKEDLQHALSLSSPFINTKAQLPILSNIVFVANKTKLTLLATNLEMSLSHSIGAKIEEEGIAAIPARTITEIISNLPTGQVAFETQKEQLKIASSGVEASLPIMPANDFPKIPKEPAKLPTLVLPKDEFLQSLSEVLFAVSLDETRPILTGVLFVFAPDKISLVASDGFRLSQKSLNLKSPRVTVKSDKQIVLPKNALSQLAKLVGDDKEINLQIQEGNNQALFLVGDSCLTTRIIEGTFPNFEKIIPTSTNTKISVNREDLLRHIKLAGVFAKDAGNAVKLKVGEASLEISAESAQVGRQKGSLEAKVVGPSVEISFNYHFLLDFLNIARGESVDISLNDSTSPALFTDPQNPDLLHLIMPIKIQN